jgi:hypothetical protein
MTIKLETLFLLLYPLLTLLLLHLIPYLILLLIIGLIPVLIFFFFVLDVISLIVKILVSALLSLEMVKFKAYRGRIIWFQEQAKLGQVFEGRVQDRCLVVIVSRILSRNLVLLDIFSEMPHFTHVVFEITIQQAHIVIRL